MIRFRYRPTFDDWFALNRILALRQLRFLIGLAGALLGLFLIHPFALEAVGRNEGGILQTYRNSLAVLFIPGLTGFLLLATYRAVRKPLACRRRIEGRAGVRHR